jgi:hypothetical protein
MSQFNPSFCKNCSIFLFGVASYTKNTFGTCSPRVGLCPRSTHPRTFKKVRPKFFMSLVARQEVEPSGSTSLQERIAINSIKVVLKIFLMSAEDPLRGFSSQRKFFNLHLDYNISFLINLNMDSI